MGVNTLKTNIFEIMILCIGNADQVDNAIVNEEGVNRRIILLKRPSIDTDYQALRIRISLKITSRFLRGKSMLSAGEESPKRFTVNLPPFFEAQMHNCFK